MPSAKEWKQRLYTDRKGPFYRFPEEARRLVGENSTVLHGGCGADSSIGFREVARLTLGLDADEWICQNTDLDLALMGDLCHLPLVDECMDLVAARWVVEHMNHPALFFQEVARVLKPGGQLLLLTTNLHHYFALAVRITPIRFQRRFLQSTLETDPHDVFPTFYRANTIRRVRALAAEAGLIEERLEMLEGSPDFLLFNSVAYLAGVAYERIVNRFQTLGGLRGCILAVFSKPRRRLYECPDAGSLHAEICTGHSGN
jgi:SAM-dependent methyltransferase